MEPVYRTSLVIPPHEIDFANRLKVSSFFGYIQTMAAAHAEQFNLGYGRLHESGLFWVISWVKLEVDRFPHYQETITVETWPHSRYRLFSLRDFLFKDAQEQIFARARTAWLLVDANAKHIASLDRLPRPVPYYTEQTGLDALPAKIAAPSGAEWVSEKQIHYSDLDLNTHTNNARYVESILDCYPLEFHASHQLHSLEISFQTESVFGDHLDLSRKVDEFSPTHHHIVAAKAGDHKPVFQALLEWGNTPSE